MGLSRRRSGLTLKHDVGGISDAAPAPKNASNKPWSDYQQSDYTPEQWHAACLIHNHDGPPTSKDDCKLPVKEPDGTLNSNGVFAAAAALAGARGGVQASPDQKTSAAKALVGYYNKMGKKPPPSLSQMAHSMEVDKFLSHYGVPGMHWGFRHPTNRVKKGTYPRAHDTKVVEKLGKRPLHSLSNQDLKKVNERLNLEQNYKRLNPTKLQRGEARAKQILGVVGTGTTIAAILSNSKMRGLVETGAKVVLRAISRGQVS